MEIRDGNIIKREFWLSSIYLFCLTEMWLQQDDYVILNESTLMNCPWRICRGGGLAAILHFSLTIDHKAWLALDPNMQTPQNIWYSTVHLHSKPTEINYPINAVTLVWKKCLPLTVLSVFTFLAPVTDTSDQHQLTLGIWVRRMSLLTIAMGSLKVTLLLSSWKKTNRVS